MAIDIVTEQTDNYALLDSGDEMKLERFGEWTLARPDPQALWSKRLDVSDWAAAHGTYERKGKSGVWHMNKELPEAWDIVFGGFSFTIKPTSFKHVGLFPEHENSWQWIYDRIMARADGVEGKSEAMLQPFAQYLPFRVLNLFGYTGGATLAAARSGAEVVHVDASKVAVAWAKQNAELSGLGKAKVRWIVDDALAFVRREIKRGEKYDAIILDPPAFGHGPNDELWKIEEDLPKLIALCKQLLTDKPIFILVNGYAAGYSHYSLENILEPLQRERGGVIEGGELTIKEAPTAPPSFLVVHSVRGPTRLLPAGIYARLTF